MGRSAEQGLRRAAAAAKDLILESVKLQERIVRLDQMLGLEQAQAPGEADHPLSMQLSRLREAFGTDGD